MPSTAPSTSTTTCVAKIPYLNSAPFFQGLVLAERYRLTDCVPRQLGERAAAGEILAGLLPVADYLRLSDRFERLGHFGIAVRGRVRSVLLFARAPLRQLDGATVAVTDETSTSACLLRLILEQRYHIPPKAYQRVDNGEAARPGAGESRAGDALLLIGDEALRFKQANTRYPFEIDLAFEWWLWQHLPFVFAVWAIRKDAGEQEKRQLESALARALGANLTQLDAIAAQSAQTLNTPAAELTEYLSRFVYRLGHVEEEAISQFHTLAHAAHLL